jgi:hypothetical protein
LTDLGELYLVFLVLYLFECLAWVPRRSVGFYTWAGCWRARAAFRPNSGWSLAVVLGKPWPPLAPPWFAEPLPFALDPSGITLIESGGQHLAWNALGPVRARGHRIEADDLSISLSISTASHSTAAALAAMLESVRTSPSKRREAELRKFLDRRYDVELPKTRQQQFAKTVRVVRVLSNALWLSLFGGLGVAVLSRNLAHLLLVAALSLVLWPANSVAFALCLRKLGWLPVGAKPDRSKRWVAFLSPISGVRAVDMVAREAWADLEPLAVAAALLLPRDLSTFARPLLVAAEARPDHALAWWHAENRQRIERVLEKKAIHVADLLTQPPRESARVQSYCPACLAQFADTPEHLQYCTSERCVEVPLRRFAN